MARGQLAAARRPLALVAPPLLVLDPPSRAAAAAMAEATQVRLARQQGPPMPAPAPVSTPPSNLQNTRLCAR